MYAFVIQRGDQRGDPLRAGVRALTLVAALLVAACSQQPRVARLSGASMGTTWNVTVVAPGAISDDALRTLVQVELDAVEHSMSTWKPDSELSRLNRSAPGVWVEVSAPLATVLSAALELWQASDGAFDVTVAPLVRLWGFGPDAAAEPPTQAQLAMTRRRVGSQWIRLEGRRVLRQHPVEIDLSAIAKGYAVDRVADTLFDAGHENFLVEVGGEVRIAGHNPHGDPWRLGVERPDAGSREVAMRLALSAGAVATSGDYRNFIEYNGTRRSHTIDPRTGAPVTHGLASVTVVSETAMYADGWATALDVLGTTDGLALARQRGLAALFIMRTADGFEVHATPAFEPLLIDPLATSGGGVGASEE